MALNIYEKLQTVRVELQKKNLKKSGKNTFAGYDYYELGDFLPQVNNLCLEYKIATLIDFSGTDHVILKVIDIDKPENIILFYSPVVAASVKGAQTIQNLGATETYQRRYLYMMAFEIAESDTVDAMQSNDKTKDITQTKQGNKPQPSASNSQLVNEGHIKSLISKGIKADLGESDLQKLAQWKYGVDSLAKLHIPNFVAMMNGLEVLWEEFLKVKIN